MPENQSENPPTTEPVGIKKPIRVAAITTTYFPGSHADVIVGKFLRGFPTDDGLLAPRTKIVSLYIDQVHQKDIGLQVAHKFEIPVFESIRAALTLGGSELAVDITSSDSSVVVTHSWGLPPYLSATAWATSGSPVVNRHS